jgi:hypothetical protein
VLAPQSDDEIRPVELALRELDDRIRIRWNPRAVVTRPGSIDATGRTIPPTHEGRWEVLVVREGEQDHCIYQVRWDGDGNEAYRPVGPWLIEFMRLWDRQNVHYVEALRRMAAEEDATLRANAALAEEEDREFWDRCGFILGKSETFGGTFGTSPRLRGADSSATTLATPATLTTTSPEDA